MTTSETPQSDDNKIPTRGHTQACPNPIAALIRMGAEEAGRLQGNCRAVTKVQRMINSLQWRQAHSKDEFYPLALESGKVLRFRQLQAGEVTGLGTGATVWPAAHVLAKYLELRFGEGGMKGSQTVDLGSGTGVAGIVAASLGAEAFLTDQEQLLFLMRENAERCAREAKAASTTSTAKAMPEINAMHVLTYDWGMDDGELSPPVDVVLVSDCVLPKLYPIEPLVNAIDRLSGPDTVTIMSYEHRHYQAFDPRRRFEELATARGLVKINIPQAQQHPIFSADDIEIWEVRRRRPRDEHSGATLHAAEAEENRVAAKQCTSAKAKLITGTAGGDVVVEYQRQSSSSGGELMAETQVTVCMLGERHELKQTPSGAIGCYLWPSAVVMARHLVTPNVVGGIDKGPGALKTPLYPPRASVLELGSGVGLVAMATALLGWNVVATDKAGALPLLESNVKQCLSSTKRAGAGTVDVLEYDWGADARELLAGRTNASGGVGYDLVFCADCVYAKASVEPLMATLCQVCDENTIVVVTNELRSAFDEFIQRARGNFQVEDIPVLEDQMVVDTSSNQRPRPVALKRLRRRHVLPPSTDNHP